MKLRTQTFFPLRALAVCAALAVMLLWMEGGSFTDALRLLTGVLPVGTSGEGLLRWCLARTAASFGLVSLALVLGLSAALALAVMSSRWGGFLCRIIGWLGNTLSGIPPMAWAMGVMVLLIQVGGLPIGTLFPYDPPELRDSWTLRLGRTLWSWLVPAVVLALPIFGSALFTLTHRLRALLEGASVGPWRGRGLTRSMMVFRHLLPHLLEVLLSKARTLTAMTLAFTIPVEELLRFDGWGRFAATALRDQQGFQLAGMLYLSGFMLACWYALIGWMEQALRKPRGMKQAPLPRVPPEEAQSWLPVTLGGMLAGGLVVFPSWWSGPGGWEAAWEVSQFEVYRAVLVAVTATVLIFLSGPMMVWRRGWQAVPEEGLARTLAAAPLLVCWLAFAVMGQRDTALLGLVLVAALPGAAAFRESFAYLSRSGFVTASWMMGRRPLAVWFSHLLPALFPAMVARMLRSVSTVLLWWSFLGYFQTRIFSKVAPSWGEQMRENAELILDAPWPALLPAVWLALWSLSFRLLSRAWPTETRLPRTSPFDPQ